MCVCRDVDDVHDMMDDISEQNEIATEITEALSAPIGFNQELDDVSSPSSSSLELYQGTFLGFHRLQPGT